MGVEQVLVRIAIHRGRARHHCLKRGCCMNRFDGTASARRSARLPCNGRKPLRRTESTSEIDHYLANRSIRQPRAGRLSTAAERHTGMAGFEDTQRRAWSGPLAPIPREPGSSFLSMNSLCPRSLSGDSRSSDRSR